MLKKVPEKHLHHGASLDASELTDRSIERQTNKMMSNIPDGEGGNIKYAAQYLAKVYGTLETICEEVDD
jgi:hypothetical protein